ncbi:MAG: hypothetical protein LBT55_02900 [Clostridiaceae bacterium]|jgi:hypothetical protein|nr:hypothetical protein [Clostridiaceae bacterium]
MLASYYKQILELTDGFAKYKKLPKLSYVFKFLALAALAAGVFVSNYFYIGTAVLLIIGIACNQTYFSAIAEYNYVVSDGVLYFEKVSVLKKITVIKALPICEIEKFTNYTGGNEGIFFTDAQGGKKLIFSENGREISIIFTPDIYLSALISTILNGGEAYFAAGQSENRGGARFVPYAPFSGRAAFETIISPTGADAWTDAGDNRGTDGTISDDEELLL